MITDPIDTVNIRQIKLVNGDEIIAFVQSVNQDGIVIEKPYKIVSQIGQNGHRMVGFFTEWMSLGKDKSTYTIYPAHIISHEEVENHIKENYIKTVLYERAREDEPEEYDEELEEEFANATITSKMIH